MAEKRRRIMEGYMTVEATVIFVTALSAIVFIMFCGFYQYEKCIMELDTYYEVQQSLYSGSAIQEDIKMEANKAYTQRTKKLDFWIGLLGVVDIETNAEAEAKTLQPSFVLRLSQRWKEAKDERNTEEQSTVSPDGGFRGE